MATKTSLVINATNAGKVIQKTLTDINPAAENSALKTWGQMLNGLTTNTYMKTDRIDKTNVDDSVEKLTPLVKLNDAADPLKRSVCLNGASPLLDVTTDGELSIVTGDSVSWCTTIYKKVDGSAYRLYVGIVNSQTAGQATAPYDIVIRSAETDTYKAGEFHITINADE